MNESDREQVNKLCARVIEEQDREAFNRLLAELAVLLDRILGPERPPN